MSATEQTKSAEVAALRSRIAKVIPCGTCATGIAIEMVRRHWEPNGKEYDWRGSRFGHRCDVSTKGPTPAQDTALQAIEAEYTGKESAA